MIVAKSWKTECQHTTDLSPEVESREIAATVSIKCDVGVVPRARNKRIKLWSAHNAEILSNIGLNYA
jgi:hypothetical protein